MPAILKTSLAMMFMVFVAGCGKREEAVGNPQPASPIVIETKAENGWPLYEVSSGGFALSLPSDWRQFDMDPATFETTMRDALRKNPQFEKFFGNLRQQLAAGIKFFGVDEATIGSGFATNANVLTVQSGGSLATAVADTLKELERLPAVAKPITHDRIKITAGDCERFRYRLTMQGPLGKPQHLAITQFLVIKGPLGHVITLTTLPDQEPKYTETFDQIGKSFRYTK